jgi:hypothetical protein
MRGKIVENSGNRQRVLITRPGSSGIRSIPTARSAVLLIETYFSRPIATCSQRLGGSGPNGPPPESLNLGIDTVVVDSLKAP